MYRIDLFVIFGFIGFFDLCILKQSSDMYLDLDKRHDFRIIDYIQEIKSNKVQIKRYQIDLKNQDLDNVIQTATSINCNKLYHNE